MTEREKEYVCDKLCKYPYFFKFHPEELEQACEACMLNQTRTQKRKEYMKQYYRTKIKPVRKKKQRCGMERGDCLPSQDYP